MLANTTKKDRFIALVMGAQPPQEAYTEMSTLCYMRPDDVPFAKWVKDHDWTFNAIIALFRWQCLQFNGGLDWEEFENMYDIFKNKIYSYIQ